MAVASSITPATPPRHLGLGWDLLAFSSRRFVFLLVFFSFISFSHFLTEGFNRISWNPTSIQSVIHLHIALCKFTHLRFCITLNLHIFHFSLYSIDFFLTFSPPVLEISLFPPFPGFFFHLFPAFNPEEKKEWELLSVYLSVATTGGQQVIFGGKNNTKWDWNQGPRRTAELATHGWGAGVAEWVRRQTITPKVFGSNPTYQGFFRRSIFCLPPAG